MVGKDWRGVAQDDFLWKFLCFKKWPSICTRPTPPSTTYYMIYSACYRRRPYGIKNKEESFFPSERGCYPYHWEYQDLPPPRLSFDDLELYVDIWVENQLIFSEVIPGAVFKAGIDSSQGEMRFHLVDESCKIAKLAMESEFDPPWGPTLKASVLVGRKDYNKIACIIYRANFFQIQKSYGARGDDYLNFSPSQPDLPDTMAWIDLQFCEKQNEGLIDVRGIEIDFDEVVESEDEVLWLLEMLDWK